MDILNDMPVIIIATARLALNIQTEKLWEHIFFFRIHLEPRAETIDEEEVFEGENAKQPTKIKRKESKEKKKKDTKKEGENKEATKEGAASEQAQAKQDHQQTTEYVLIAAQRSW